MAETKLTGTYKHQKNENYNDYLKALSMIYYLFFNNFMYDFSQFKEK